MNVLASVSRRLANPVVAAAPVEFIRASELPSRYEIDQLVELRLKAFTMVAIVLAVKFTGQKVLYDLGVYTGYMMQDQAGTHGLNNSLCYDENGQEMIRVLAVDSWFVHPHGDGVSTLLPVLDNIETEQLATPPTEDAFERPAATVFDPVTTPVSESDAILDASDEARTNLDGQRPVSLEHSAIDGRATTVRQITIEGTETAVATLFNLLAAISYNTQVGHSCVMGAYFDGDGADKIRVIGLPDNTGEDQAKACSDHGDGVLALIGTDTAQTYNERYITHEGEDGILLVRKTVWPKEQLETPAENPAPEENNDVDAHSEEPVAPDAAEADDAGASAADKAIE